ncbi:glycosyltransferase family 4 protein [Ilyomonas limi]|uniref:Glycosyltransferase family 4 protein n=1 Tax=Ilyomonas limi TaxID=2575867 RepID=A0A4U3L8R4_9BACT|nr:glycosyltransferase family 4 protein [Ilyomonas limi]TKK70854.1 glycosyltransferase family 4 protein [Ilyomonas limi]
MLICCMYVIGAILPHTKLFGGVRRFFELGERFIQQGHQMIILTPEGLPPEWFHFSGKMDRLENMQQHHFTALFITETVFINELLLANALLKIFYHVIPTAKIDKILQHKEITIFVNSTSSFEYVKKRYGIELIKQIGGINLPAQTKDLHQPEDVFTIMCYGRLSRKKKGTRIVVKAAEKLHRLGYPVKLLLYDTPIDEKSKQLINNFHPKAPFEFVLNHPVDKNDELFKRASVFVAVERKAGWTNTAAEAMASGIPVIGTDIGTKDFLIPNETGIVVKRYAYFVRKALEKLINDKALRIKLGENGRRKIEAFSWDILANNILAFIAQKIGNKS